MIKFENCEVLGFDHAIRGMRNPLNSWYKSDSKFCSEFENCEECPMCNPVWKNFDNTEYETSCKIPYGASFVIGPNDHKLMTDLANAGPSHSKFRRMIVTYVDITAPLYWWKEFDTYKVGTVANSCSTMHKIADKEFTIDDFSREHLFGIGDLVELMKESNSAYNIWMSPNGLLTLMVDVLNECRAQYLETKDKKYWWQMIQLLPSSYNQKRTVILNYEVLSNIYHTRKNHKLDEWHDLCEWIEMLPYSEIIIGKEKEE